MFKQKRKINLTIPTSYNRCSIAQLRGLSQIMIEMAAKSNRLRPFDMDSYRVAAFLYLTELEVVSPINPRVPVEEQYLLVRFRASRLKKFVNKLRNDNKPFALYLWQIYSWVGKSDPAPHPCSGMLDWLSNDGASPFVLFPFDELRLRSSKWYKLRKKRFRGPAPMLDGFSWQRYRFAQDYMEHYVTQQNRLVELLAQGTRVSPSDLLKAESNVQTAKALFLSTIFDAKINFVDQSTRQVRKDFHYQSNQSTDNLEYFRNFSDVDWQIILLWWSGTMQWLSKTYPKVFKKQPSKPKKPVNPLAMYARTTATLEKYIGINAEDVDREPYTAILQQMEDIVRQNEEIEKISKKK